MTGIWRGVFRGRRVLREDKRTKRGCKIKIEGDDFILEGGCVSSFIVFSVGLWLLYRWAGY